MQPEGPSSGMRKLVELSSGLSQRRAHLNHKRRFAANKIHRPAQALGRRGAIVVFGTIAALYLAREIFIPFAFALNLTFLFTPVAALLQRAHAGHSACL